MSAALKFTETESLPDGLLEAQPAGLLELLGGPTLIHLRGRLAPPLFISVLLHGNETTGFLALQKLLRKYNRRELPRALSFFIGNVEAARLGVRRLNGQPDYNRVWPGTEAPSCPESLLARQVVDIMTRRGVFASLDIHNNTGLNPHYACVNRLEPQFLQLAALFGRLVVYFVRPKGVLSAAFAGLAPSVTVECGKVGQGYGVDHVREYMDSCLHWSEIPHHPLHRGDIDLYHTVAQVQIRESVTFGFDPCEPVDFVLDRGIETMNFHEVGAGTPLGMLTGNLSMPLIARNDEGEDVTLEFFRLEGRHVVLNKAMMPSMLTLNQQVIRQDCLCYLMERIALP